MEAYETGTAVETARALAGQIAARADAADRAGRLPPEDIAALKAARCTGWSVPREHGGWGLTMREHVEAQMALAEGSGATAIVLAMTGQIFGHARETQPWPAEDYERFCAWAAEGAFFNSVASEPAMGSPSRGAFFRTRAERDGDCWRINGHKNWITGGEHLDYMLVSLSVDDGTGLMLVPNGLPGIEWQHTWGDALSLRASSSDDVFFHDVRVPVDHLISRADGPKKTPNAWFPMLLAATYLGVATAARDAIIRYALERVPTNLGKPIATLPKIQRQIGEIDMALQAARLMLLDTAAAWTGTLENRSQVYPRVVLAKHLASETAIDVTDRALRIAGGAALSHDLPLERYFRDVRAGAFQPPSGDTALEMIGRSAIEAVQAASPSS